VTDPATRLLSLLSLLQTPRLWPGSELADRLGVSGRTVRRDIDRLREIGYFVEATAGGQGGYRLTGGSAMPPLLLDDAEAVAIAVGLGTIAGQAVAGVDEAAVRAATKLAQVLPPRLRRRVTTLTAATLPFSLAARPVVSPDNLITVASASANRERMRFRYRGHDGAESARHTEPLRLVANGGRWYLLAFDIDRDDWRTFRLDRMADLRATGARAHHRTLPEASVADFLRTQAMSMAPTFRADVTIHAPLRHVTTQLGDHLGDGTLTESGDSCRWHSHLDTTEWLATRLLSLNTDFQVHGPPELVAHLDAIARRITRSDRLTRGGEQSG